MLFFNYSIVHLDVFIIGQRGNNSGLIHFYIKIKGIIHTKRLMPGRYYSPLLNPVFFMESSQGYIYSLL